MKLLINLLQTTGHALNKLKDNQAEYVATEGHSIVHQLISVFLHLQHLDCDTDLAQQWLLSILSDDTSTWKISISTCDCSLENDLNVKCALRSRHPIKM